MIRTGSQMEKQTARKCFQEGLICTRRAGKLERARYRLYRSQILQENMRLKALAEIYTMHSFAPFWNPYAKTGEKGAWPKQPRKGRKRENERPISSAQQAT